MAASPAVLVMLDPPWPDVLPMVTMSPVPCVTTTCLPFPRVMVALLPLSVTREMLADSELVAGVFARGRSNTTRASVTSPSVGSTTCAPGCASGGEGISLRPGMRIESSAAPFGTPSKVKVPSPRTSTLRASAPSSAMTMICACGGIEALSGTTILPAIRRPGPTTKVPASVLALPSPTFTIFGAATPRDAASIGVYTV